MITTATPAAHDLILTTDDALVAACTECGEASDEVEAFESYCGSRRDAEGLNFCTECMPRCHCADCDGDYANDLRFNN